MAIFTISMDIECLLQSLSPSICSFFVEVIHFLGSISSKMCCVPWGCCKWIFPGTPSQWACYLCLGGLLFFCKLILYPSTLLKLSIVSKCFLVKFLGSLMGDIVSSANRGKMTSLLTRNLVISLSCLIALASISALHWKVLGIADNSILFLILTGFLWVFLHLG